MKTEDNCTLLTVSGRKAAIFHGESDAIVYLHAEKYEAAAIFSMLIAPRPSIAAISGTDWNAELSPWAAKRAFRAGEDFAGGARVYLHLLVYELIPAVEGALDKAPAKRYLAGYSLAGLFAVFAQLETEIFDGFASVSGSLWYDGFTDYALSSKPKRLPARAYFSVGSKEKMTKNMRLASVEDNTRIVEKRFAELGAETIFELNEGGHFNEPDKRTAKGINWLTRQ